KEIKHDYELTLQIFGIEHKRIRVGTPQSNGFVERFNRTVLEELQKDLDTYLWHYNFQRPHLGNRLKGKRPIEVLLDRSTYPKRLTCDKMSPSESQEVSTHLETCTN
ncbi:MAG: integrase core domain-containing protein, partial [Candidatus Omnitrophica bacterium]|nr:integrase core domain-containing protein [Candidatus Omnitrophota bacterium]